MDYPQDIPMNYRRKVPYQGNLSDLLYAPGYDKLQQDLVKVDRDKLARQYQVETSPEAMDLLGWKRMFQMQSDAEREAAQREAAHKAWQQQQWQQALQQGQQLVAKQAQEQAMRPETYKTGTGVITAVTPSEKARLSALMSNSRVLGGRGF